MIQNEKFWQHWREGRFEEALRCQMQQKSKKKGALLFQAAKSDTNTIAAISAGEFLYDYFMIDPTVVKGIDFARSEDLASLFQLSNFAATVDLSSATGDMAQLQGYVAEQMIAQQLAAAGHDVQFPNKSNQAGWDILVDGEPFQVKCGATKQIVNAHFDKYPEIPVYVNAELAEYYTDNPLVLSTTVTREQVINETMRTLEHADDLLQFEIPWIAAGVSAFSNAKRMRYEQIHFSTAVRNVVADTASRTAMAAVGKAVIGGTGAMLLPGAGAIVFPIVGAYAGVTQGGKVAAALKKRFARDEYRTLCVALQRLIDKMLVVLSTKKQIKTEKWLELQSNMPAQVSFAFESYHAERMTLLENVCRELEAIMKTAEVDALIAFERIINVLGKGGIHLYSLRSELTAVEDAMRDYYKKV